MWVPSVYPARVARLLFTPRWLALTVVAVLLLVAFVLLGRWQWQRTFRAPDGWSDEPAAVALASLDPTGVPLPSGAVARQVLAVGSYDSAHQLLVAGQRLSGQSVYWVLTPLRLADGSMVEVVRGWVTGSQDPLVAAPTGQVQVTGRLRPDDAAHSAAGLPRGQVRTIDAALAADLGGPVHDGYLIRTAQSPPDPLSLQPVPTPAPPPSSPPPRQFHLQNFLYTLQWNILAIAVVVMWWRLLRDDARVRSQRPTAAQTDPAQVRA